MSILAKHPDGLGFFYGFVEGDHRQVNVRLEGSARGTHWQCYVGGEPIDGEHSTKDEAEAAAIAWLKSNPAD